MSEVQLKHKWFLRNDSKYECMNCHRVFTKQEVSIARSLQNSSEVLIDPVPILQCVKQLEEKEPLEFEGTPQEVVSIYDGLKQRTTEEAFVVKVKIPYGAIIDLEHHTFDTLHYAGEVLSLKLLGIDSDGFLFFECRMRKSR
jgi:hypothetical protein